MHDLNRTQLESADEAFESDEFAFEEGELLGEADGESPFNETEEMELATELMSILERRRARPVSGQAPEAGMARCEESGVQSRAAAGGHPAWSGQESASVRGRGARIVHSDSRRGDCRGVGARGGPQQGAGVRT